MSARTSFFARVRKTSGCWLWQGPRDSKGYAIVHTLGEQRGHRAVWVLTKGPVPAGMCVLHRCDNPPCVRPSHLFLGTHADNAADKVAKGRQPRGETNGRARLTWRQVRAIRRRYLAGGVEIRALAVEYGVGHSTVGYIVDGTTWKETRR